MANNNLYKTLQEAADAAQALGINNMVEYKARYREDEMLPSSPGTYYPLEWAGPSRFFSWVNRRYATYAEAKEAVKALHVYTAKQYRKFYKKDPLLPGWPEEVYVDLWMGWNDFLPPNPDHRFYPSLKEAGQAAVAIAITSSEEYKKRYKEDSRLPSNPNNVYEKEWVGFADFFDGHVERYATYAEGSAAVKRLQIYTMSQYKQSCDQDPKLPATPEKYYGDEWAGWVDFLPVNPDPKFYATMAEAAEAVKRLGITTKAEYNVRYREDPKLASNPNAIYENEWVGFPDFFDRLVQRYETYEEAKEATKSLGAYTMQQYRLLCKIDHRLPAYPEEFYGKDFKGARDFLPPSPDSRFYTFKEAVFAVQKLGIKTSLEYKKRYREDPRLPANPNTVYKAEWNGFKDFFGLRVDYYATYAEAKEAAKALGAYTTLQYKTLHVNDSRLPTSPQDVYRREWTNWPDFLPPNPDKRKGKYATLAQASAVVKKLGIRTQREYIERHRADEKLPFSPAQYYASEWTGWGDFTGHVYREKHESYYATYAEAKEAAQKLGAVSGGDYRSKVAQDEKLSPFPDKTYAKEWKGWNDYLGTVSHAEKYATYEEARAAARALNFGSNTNYVRTYKAVDPRLPGAPAKFYGKDWMGWADYLGSRKGKIFYSYEEAKRRVAELEIYSAKQYAQDYRKDPMLPSVPDRTYADYWEGWGRFVITRAVVAFYETLEQAKEAVRRLDITSSIEYKIRHSEDPRLPSNPNIKYANEWIGFPDLLGDYVPKYATVTEASTAAQRLGFRTKEQYLEGYKEDPRLPASPQVMYADKWEAWGWDAYLGVEKYRDLYEAGAAARALGITGSSEYLRLSKGDPRLPADPIDYYRSLWKGWVDFLLPETCLTLADVKFVIKVVKIKNSVEYREEYGNYSCLPAHPDRVFNHEFVDWYDLCDIARPYSYEECSRIVIDNGVAGGMAYRAFRAAQNDPRLPQNPASTYKDRWVNWHRFVGKQEPLNTGNIRAPYLPWKDAIDEFMKSSRGADTKVASLCRFVRYYIQKYALGTSPEAFLTSPKIDLKLFDAFTSEQSDNNARYIIAAVKEFCDHILLRKLTVEDEDTSELVLVPNARNPFAAVQYGGSGSGGNLGESSKPALAYQFVHAMGEWMVPDTAQTYADLGHLQVFDADWVEVDPSIVDPDDPDCVFKQEHGKTKMWNPVSWMHTFALASVPARGKQLGYNDSGEGDREIPDVVDGKIVWVRNTSALAGTTEDQGFIKRYPDEQIGMHFTSNKTSSDGLGYNVAWMPQKLAIWMIRLRKWQAKYNPISRPMPWLECVRTDLNETQRKARGANCFLFRDFGGEECAHFAHRLKDRLAAALFYSQPPSLALAECNGSMSALSGYQSKYTPHSMRVSLITAYVMEFGLPLEVVMKIAGHSAIVMTIYYVKLNAEGMRQKFSEGEKRALSNQAYMAMQMIEQGRIEEVRSQLITNNEEALLRYMGSSAAGSMLFRDYGFCPFAGTRCEDGGPLIGKTKVRQPVAAGYLGMQNCLRCRHFVSGPVFIGGLLAIANEISLQASIQFEHIADLESSIKEMTKRIDELDVEQYVAIKAGRKFNESERNWLEMKIRKTRSESESASKKADLYLCDIQAVSRLINQSQALLNEQASSGADTNLPQLIVHTGHELHVAMEETSRFHQLHEVCENAEIYESASAELALAPRSQMIDKMIAFNNMMPTMYALDKKQQLVIGNQMTNFLLARVKSWDKVDKLIEGKLLLQDLGDQECIAPTDIQAILAGRQPAALEVSVL
jgi:hypothetical protein